MATKVLDSWALMAFLKDEPAAEEVEKLLIKASQDKMKLLLNIFSWTEIYSSLLRTESKERADEAVGIISEFPITIVHADDELARMAANYRATTGIPYPSCFAAATAKIKAAELVTGDPEFKQLEGEIKILWLGKK